MMRRGSVFAAACLSAFGVFGATAIQTALDNTSLTFTTGGDAEWFSQSSAVHAGTTALRSGAISDDGETWVETTVSGAGMVSFWWKASSESVDWDWLEVSVDGNVQDKIGGSDAGWKQKSVVAVGTGSHTVRWRYRKDYSYSEGADCGWLDKVEWTQAPSAIRVTYAVNGGDALDPDELAPGVTFGELPVPERAGYEFLGWYMDSALKQFGSAEELLPFEADVTVYAKWGISVSQMDGAGIAFSSEGNYWWAAPNAGHDGGYAAQTDVPFFMEAGSDGLVHEVQVDGEVLGFGALW